MFNSNASSAAGDANYIEDVFNTYVYTGSNSATTITNGIDLSTKGGLVWTKGRTGSADNHLLIDTVRGVNKPLRSNETAAQYTETTLTAFNTTGYDITGANGDINLSGRNYVSWTFREQAKFFDIVTYTGNSTARTIAHNLGSVPGCIIVKKTNNTGQWCVYHRGMPSASNAIFLNLTNAQTTDPAVWNSTAPTSTEFSLGDSTGVNNSGDTYVAYLFAHDAGGFGLTGTDNVISCGSFTTDGSGNATVTLGYEPQWVLIKRTDGAQNWLLNDVMRGMSLGQTSSNVLFPNTSAAEYTAWSASPVLPNATGFIANGSGSGGLSASATFIYIAIRRGPMAVPTLGTSVFAPVNQTGGGTVTTNFPVDLLISTTPSQTSYRSVNDRLRGASTTTDVPLYTNRTDAEVVGAGYGFGFDNNTGFKDGVYTNSFTDLYLSFKRAPGFFDEVCYTGTGSATTVTHNLAAVPELIICKQRNSANSWFVYAAPLGASQGVALNGNFAAFSTTGASSLWNETTPTSSVFSLGGSTSVNASASTYVAYLFATCAGVSKVGSYTGTGTTLQINCGFTSGARFVLIRRTSAASSDWYVWDTARGIIAGNDPYILLNSDAAEVTGTDYIDTVATGFELTATAPAAINASGGTFIFLAIA